MSLAHTGSSSWVDPHSWELRERTGEGTQLVWVLPGQWGWLCAGRELSSLFIPATKQEKNTPAECIQK